MVSLGPYYKHQGYRRIGINIYLIVNIISYASLYSDEYMCQIPFQGQPYANFQLL